MQLASSNMCINKTARMFKYLCQYDQHVKAYALIQMSCKEYATI